MENASGAIFSYELSSIWKRKSEQSERVSFRSDTYQRVKKAFSML